MIETRDITKTFDDIRAVDHISLTIRNGMVFGLIGSNGAGKSTLLKLLTGILKPDEGTIRIDEEPIYENTQKKADCFYISDDQFYFSNATPYMLGDYYKNIYPTFQTDRFHEMLKIFELDGGRKIQTFSKGMKKQLSLLAALSAGVRYIFCDETFDGLDPVARQAAKSLIAAEVADRELTPVIASHNLRELEDICDHVGLLHKGGVLLSKDLDDMKLSIHKVQCVFSEPVTKESFVGLDLLNLEQRGSLYTATVRGDKDEISARISNMGPIFSEMLPLSLEEIFVSETEVYGYDIKKLLF